MGGFQTNPVSTVSINLLWSVSYASANAIPLSVRALMYEDVPWNSREKYSSAYQSR